MDLKQSTSVVVSFGPFLDKTDGVTLETGLVSAIDHASTGILLSKNGGTLTIRHATVTASTYDAHGCYKVTLDTTDTGTLGTLRAIYTDAATCLPVWMDFNILPAAMWNSLYATSGGNLPNAAAEAAGGLYTRGTGAGQINQDANGRVDTNTAAISTDATAADNMEADYDGSQHNATRSATAKFVADIIESQRGHHTWHGNVYYVDGYGGNDTTGDGSRLLPYKTISKALTICTTGNHDIVECVANSGQVPTIISETATITVSKAYTFIRGPGRGVQVDLTGAGYVFDVTAVGVEISGFDLVGNGTGSSGAITVSTADFAYLHDLWISSPTQDGIGLTVSNNSLIERCLITGSGRDNIRVASGGGAGQFVRVLNCTIRSAVGVGVNFLGSDASKGQVRFCVIRDNATGISVSSGTTDTVITDNRFINNTATIADSGTRTLSVWNLLNTDTTGNVSLANPIRLQKNVAFNNFMFDMIDSTDHVTPKSGLTITATRSIDGAAFGACTNAASEVESGTYKINLSASDLNGNMIMLRFTASGGDDQKIGIITDLA